MTVKRRVFLGERVQLHLTAHSTGGTGSGAASSAVESPREPEGGDLTLLAEVGRDHSVKRGDVVGVTVAPGRWMPWFEESR